MEGGIKDQSNHFALAELAGACRFCRWGCALPAWLAIYQVSKTSLTGAPLPIVAAICVENTI